MKLPSSKSFLLSPVLALSSLFAATLSANELVPLNEFISEAEFLQTFTVSAGFPGLSVTHSAEDDGGIGRGGFVTIPSETGATSNLIYDTDSIPGTQTFADATIAIDQRSGSSLAFFVRGNTSRTDAIRVLITSRARVRVWTAASPSEGGTAGTPQYDQTGPAARFDWNHLRLNVRNAGAGGDQVELIFSIYNSQVRFDETTLAAEHTLLLSVEDSAPYLAAGEIGFGMFGLGNGIDNFVVHEYGTAPATRPHPDLADFYPLPEAQYHAAGDGFSFRAMSPGGIDPSDIYVSLNGTDVSGALTVSGDPEDRLIHYANLVADTDYTAEIEIVAGSGEITTREVHFSTATPPTPVPLINLIEFAEESDWTGNFTVTQGSVTYIEDWDQGIGEGGTARTLANSNFVYDTDAQGDTQTFQDFSATVDHRDGASLAFIIRGNRAADQSIRVMLTNRNRIRIWTGSSLSASTTGEIHLDETIQSGLSLSEWVHMRLDVRNVGEEWDRQIEVRLRAFGSQNDLPTPAFDRTFAIPSGSSASFLAAGEIGIRGVGVNDIDNFGVYEYGTAPVWRPHPEILEIAPAPGSPGVGEDTELSFEVAGNANTPQSGIQLLINGANVSSSLSFTGDESHWFVTFPFLQPGDDVLIRATNAEASTTAFFDYPPEISPFYGRLRNVYNSGGFQDDTVFPLGDLLNVQHGNGEWSPHATVPAQILEVEEPFDKVLRMSTRQWFSFPDFNSGILIFEMDLRVSSIDVRTLDLSFTTFGSGTQRSFVGWGTVPGFFTYYDGSAWVPVFEPGTDWHRYRMVHYLTGTYTSSYDLFVDGQLVGEKLPFRSTFDPASHVLAAIRLHASSGENYAEMDNVVMKAQRLVGVDRVPYASIHEVLHNGTDASVAFDTYLGFNYIVETRDALEAGAWTELTTVPGTGGAVVVDDPGASGSRRFYRVTTMNP